MAVADHPKLEGIRATTVADVSELTADELIRQGERLLKMGHDLMSQAAHLRALEGLPEERSTGRFGVVTEKEALLTAKRLERFTRAQYAEAIGLSPAGSARWLSKLIDREHPVLERVVDEHGSHYQYLKPKPGENDAPRRRVSAISERRVSGPASTPVAGSGANLRGVPKQVRDLVREAQKDGWKLSRKGNDHWQLERNGKTVGFGSSPTNADHTAASLRRQLHSGRAHLQRTVAGNGRA